MPKQVRLARPAQVINRLAVDSTATAPIRHPPTLPSKDVATKSRAPRSGQLVRTLNWSNVSDGLRTRNSRQQLLARPLPVIEGSEMKISSVQPAGFDTNA